MISNLVKRLKELQRQPVKQNILIIDGSNQFIRANSIAQKFQKNVITIFLSEIINVVERFKPSHCIVTFDGKGGSVKRRLIYKQYKQKRQGTSKDLQIQKKMEQCKQIIRLLPLFLVQFNNIQADDTIAECVKYFKTKNTHRVVVVSSDKDFLQLIDDNVNVWSPIKKIMYDKETFLRQYQILPQNFIYCRLLEGDASDNIKGINGVGRKTILKMYKDIGTKPINGLQQFLAITNSLPYSNGRIAIQNNQQIVKRNYKLMSLQQGCLSLNYSIKIRQFIQTAELQLVPLQQVVLAKNIDRIFSENCYNLKRSVVHLFETTFEQLCKNKKLP